MFHKTRGIGSAVAGGRVALRVGLAVIGLALSAHRLPAQQVSLSVHPRHPSFVTGEPLVVQVRLANHGAQPIIIDDHEAFKNNRLFFEIRGTPHEYLAAFREGRIIDDIELEHGDAAAFDIDLAAWYPLLACARYYVNVVLINNNRRYVSDEQVFEVVPGIELARLTQVIRGPATRERHFQLVYWGRGGREDAFLRAVDQPGQTVWTTLGLGAIVRVKKPELKFESDEVITVFHQASRDVLLTSRIQSDANGPVLVDQKPMLDAVSSPMVNKLGDAVEEAMSKQPRPRRKVR